MTTTKLLTCLSLGCLCFLWSCSRIQVHNTPETTPILSYQLSHLEDSIHSWIESGIIPSMAVAVTKGDEVLWLQAYGMADQESESPATIHTAYALGSLSKSISATGVMTLVDQGILDLDQPVNPILDNVPLRSHRWNADSVKIWQVLNSCAGLPHGWTSSDETSMYHLSENEKDRIFRRYAWVTFPPGEVSHYSNYSFGVADRIMEKASGQSLEDFLQSAIFRPLGMQNSYSQYWPDRASQYARLYNRAGEETGPYHFIPLGGGGYFSSVYDLFRYGMFYAKCPLPGQKAILRSETIDQMFDFERSAGKIFQLGWHNPGHAVISNGSIGGANSNLTIVPEEELLVVCLTNQSSSKADELTDAIIDALAPDLERQYSYQDYLAEFGNPYERNDRLAGIWTGTIKTDHADIPIKIEFNETVLISLYDQPAVQLQRPIFNRHDELRGRFEGHIPVPQLDNGDQSNNELVLNLIEGELVGHIAVSFSNDHGSYRYGVFCSLEPH